jgi:peptidoglycan/LPS O-acetylase OafA/YrhL
MRIEKLESIRGFVALYVVIHHYIYFTALQSKLPPVILFFFKFSQEAVITFFLMSGFVIYIATVKKQISFKQYFQKRFFRIFPIAICALLLSALIAFANGEKLTKTDWIAFVGNMFMLQDITNEPGVIVTTFKNNFPLWSLSYEWWFYMMFFPFYQVYKSFKLRLNFMYIVTVFSLSGWLLFLYQPNHMFLIITYFALWWSGVYSAKVFLDKREFTFTNMFPALMSLFVMTLCIFIPSYLKPYGFENTHNINFRYPAHFYADAFLFILLGLLWWKAKLRVFNFLFRVFNKLSPISYALYIIHFPLIWLHLPFVDNIYLVLLIKLSVVFLLSYWLEIKLQPVINSNFNKYSRA